MRHATTGLVIGPRDGKAVDMGSLGARFLLDAAATEGRVAVLEHWIPPRTLAAPLHRHFREDEYSLVLQGRMGAMLGDRVVVAETGDFVFKVRDEWHTFWNAGDEECRLLEIISPGGFEELFREMGSNPEAMVGERARALDAKYGLDVDYDSIERICAAQGLTFPV